MKLPGAPGAPQREVELVSEAEVQGRLFALSRELRDVLEVQQRQAVRAEAAAWALPALFVLPGTALRLAHSLGQRGSEQRPGLLASRLLEDIGLQYGLLPDVILLLRDALGLEHDVNVVALCTMYSAF